MDNITLINKYKDTILEIMLSSVDNKKQLISNRKKILKYLNTTVSIDEEHLMQPIMFFKESFPENSLSVNKYSDILSRMVAFSKYILSIQNLNDGGYSLLLSYYFSLTKKLSEQDI